MNRRSLGLSQSIPPSILRGKWVVVLTCYLDDSGKDPQNRITTIAGFVAKAEHWEKFETAVEPLFAEYGVRVLHAKDLHHTIEEFAEWRVIKKQAFVYKICREMSPLVPLGVSMSALKGAYAARTAESARKRINTPYTFCFNVIIDWILRDTRIGREVHEEGIAFVIEAGHENNPEAEQCFYEVRKKFGLENVLRSISFVPKENSRAIQMADLISYFSRRQSAEIESPEKRKKEPLIPSMMDIISGAVPVRSFVATDFYDEEAGPF